MPKDKYLIIRERKMDLAPAYWNVVSQSSPRTRKIFDLKIEKIWQHFKDGVLTQFFVSKEWEESGRVVADRMFKNKNFLSAIEKEMKKAEKLTNDFLARNKKTNYSKFSFNELTKTAERIKFLWLNHNNLNVPTWYIGGDRFKELVANQLRLAEEDFLFLTTPSKKTAVSRLEYDFLKAAELIKKEEKDLKKAAEKLSKDYGWLPFGYDGPVFWDEKYFVEKLTGEIKKDRRAIEKKIKAIVKKDGETREKKKVLIKKYKLNKDEIGLIERINLITVWTDERKKLEFQLHYYYAKILKELEKRFDIPYKNLKYLFTQELVEIENNRNKILRISNARIKNDFIIEFSGGDGGVVPEKKKNILLNIIRRRCGGDTAKGIVASKGKKGVYKSRVKIVLSPKDSSKIRQGDFLVATMTTPDYVIPMKKAAGFITDEGGITCHAAIMAREMNKPCIIGTKIATKIFRDGDLVEVDAEKGVVRKIK